MSFFTGPMRKMIKGYKELTLDNEILKLDPNLVKEAYFPINDKANTKILVSVGDRVLAGQKIAEINGKYYVPIYSSISGIVRDNVKKLNSFNKTAEHLVVENDFLYEKMTYPTVSLDSTKEEIVAFIKEMGITGQGGGGFPMYVKYENYSVDTVLLNAVECEPYITADNRMIKEHLKELKLGAKALIKAANAKNLIIAIKAKFTNVIAELNDFFKDEANISVRTVGDYYPMGYEKSLIENLFKKTYDRIPHEIGIVVSNVTSAIALGKSMLSGLPIIEKLVTVSGDGINKPHNVIAPVGTLVKDLFELCGGIKYDTIQILIGGPMMGTSVLKDDVALSAHTNAVTIMEFKQYESSPCLRCSRCVDFCPIGLQPCNINLAAAAKNKERVIKLRAFDCTECGTCSFVCPSHLEVCEGIKKAKVLFK